MGYIRVYLGDQLTDQFELVKDRTTIGRAPENDLVLPDGGVSRLHATIVREGNLFFIEDNQSSNGVFVNKERVERRQLNFWDEIQIYNYVLKFMAVPRRQVEVDKEVAEADTKIGRTMVASVEDLGQLEQLRKQKRIAYPMQQNADGSKTRHVLKSASFSCGRDKSCDVRTGGWFAPKVAAVIERSGSAYQLVPEKGGKVMLNGEPVSAARELKDEDRVQVRGLSFQFFHRMAEG